MTHVFQLTTLALKISLTKTEILDVGQGSTGSLAAGREPIVENRPSYRRIEGGFEEPNNLAEPEQEQGQTRIRLMYHMQDGRTP